MAHLASEKRLAAAPRSARVVAAAPDNDLDVLRWLLGIRIRLVSGLILVLFVAALAMPVPAETTLGIAGAGSAFLVINGLYAFLLRSNPSKHLVALLQKSVTPADAVINTLLLYLSGGALTPVFIVYSLGIVTSIILLDPKGVYRTAGLSILLYCGLTVAEAYRLIPYVGAYWGTANYYYSATHQTYAIYLLAVCSALMAEAYIGNRIARVIGTRNRQISSQLRDLNTLYEIAKGLGNLSNADEMLRCLANSLQTLQDASLVIIALLTPDGRIKIKGYAGVAIEPVGKLEGITADMPQLAALLKYGEPLILEDLKQHPEFKLFSLNPSSRSAFVYPIKSEGRVLGAISLSFDKPKRISPEYHNLMLTITGQAGLALVRAQLFADTQRLAHEMSTLYNLGLYTGSTLSTREVIKRTSDNLEHLMKPHAYYIALFDEQGEQLTFEVFKEHGQDMPLMQIPLDKGGLTARIIRSRRPLLVQDWRSDAGDLNSIAGKVGADMLSYLGVPMVISDRVIGVISVQSEKPMAFDTHDERLLEALGAQTAMALENARLHQMAQEQGRLDSLTQVYNHGYFVELVHDAVATSDKTDSQVALIMLDIDHFKQYNDSYGHVAGDNVLEMVAQTLKANGRRTDAVGRWGGEEFGVLLPGAGLAEAKKVARVIRRAVAGLAPTDGYGRPIAGPTVSQGISAYPFPSASAAHLIEEADAALYKAKECGRNQLVVNDPQGMVADGNVISTPKLEMNKALG